MCFEIHVGKSDIFNVLASVGDIAGGSDLIKECIELVGRDPYGKVCMSFDNLAVVTASVVSVDGLEISACVPYIILR